MWLSSGPRGQSAERRVPAVFWTARTYQRRRRGTKRQVPYTLRTAENTVVVEVSLHLGWVSARKRGGWKYHRNSQPTIQSPRCAIIRLVPSLCPVNRPDHPNPSRSPTIQPATICSGRHDTDIAASRRLAIAQPLTTLAREPLPHCWCSGDPLLQKFSAPPCLQPYAPGFPMHFDS